MANQIITPEQIRDIFTLDATAGTLSWRVKTADKTVIGRVAGTTNGMGYVQIRVFGRIYLAHRLVWAHIHGSWPSGGIDHRNRVRNDNRPDNLRPATQSENMQNSTKSAKNKSGTKGVDWHVKSGKWRASISKGKVSTYLGVFGSKEDAIAARLRAEMELFTHSPLRG